MLRDGVPPLPGGVAATDGALDQTIADAVPNAVPQIPPGGSNRDATLSPNHPAIVDALDRTQVGVIISLRTAQPVFVNAYAGRVLEKGEALCIGANGLTALKTADTNALRSAIEMACCRELSTCVTLLLPRPTQDRRPLVVHVPVPRYASAGANLATVFLCDPHQEPVIDSFALSRLYGLTRSEAALSVLLMAGKTAEQAADCLFVSIHTVRTHLKRILSKTDTGRQADLLRVVLACSAQVCLD